MARKTQAAILLEGADEVLRRLEDIREWSSDISDVWPVLGQLWANRQRAVFATNGLGKWAPISRQAMMDDARPLIGKGEMFEGLTRQEPRFAGRRYVAYGPAKYDDRVMRPAVLHANGTRKMPKREPVPKLRASERALWVGAVRNYIRKGLD